MEIRINAVEMRFLRRKLRMSWTSHITNEEVAVKAKQAMKES